jgi:hypothetical protein
MKKINKLVLTLSFCSIVGCANKPHIVYTPSPQILPQHIKKIAVRQFKNKTQYYGLEEKLTLRVIDEFLKDATYPIVAEGQADAIVEGRINRYILTPIQYDIALVPTVYKLIVLIEVRLLDKHSQSYLWIEPALEGVQIYSDATLSGGITEEQARELVWKTLSRDVVKRTIEGFGAVTSQSERKIAPKGPDTLNSNDPETNK